MESVQITKEQISNAIQAFTQSLICINEAQNNHFESASKMVKEQLVFFYKLQDEVLEKNVKS